MARLWVVATPIGNLEDLTPRAARILTQAPVVAAESVARAKKLLSHLGLKGKRLISCREANRRQAAAQVLAALDAGQDVALISDAGTPGVSDPGVAVVQAVADSGHEISPAPGPSALAAALSVAGVAAAPLVFLGFAPAKPGPRRQLLESAAATGWPVVLFEAPHRLAETSLDLAEAFGASRRVVLARELSKVHEEVRHLTAGELAGLAATQAARGEITLVVAGGKEPQAAEAAEEKADGLLRAGLDQAGESPSALARKVAHATGLARETVYRRLLALREARQAHGEQTRTEEVEPSEAIDSVEPILRCELTVGNSLGLHARVAARIAETVQRFDSQVVLGKDGLEADGGSVLSILALDAPQGSRLSVLAKGAEAQAAVDALRALFASDFGES
ncbi:MAG: 16S rRNA (cytidine(1402)-2'-O)-methyltransferase [Thermodesulfobacteriota bacterium]